MDSDRKWMAEAIAEAKKSRESGGIPIGSVLVAQGKIIGRGHNQRVQKNNPILHAEMVTFQNAGAFGQIYTPNPLCILLYHHAQCALALLSCTKFREL
ncbi:MAG: hypothetical protein CM1200mP6_01450 [Anaerolineaceae bacterium]|nr:MAG: hypothetical protein CM1200mP6_01450 [Anaerolineaceae bacterium]